MGRYDALYQAEQTAIPKPEKQVQETVDTIKVPTPAAKRGDKSTVRVNRSDEPNDRTIKSASLIHEITEGVRDDDRPTERYSFEIYSDLKPKIEELQYLFKKRTGKKLSSSRLIREAIEAYLPKALRLLENQSEDEESSL